MDNVRGQHSEAFEDFGDVGSLMNGNGTFGMVGDFGGVELVAGFLLVLSTRTATTFRGDVSLFATAMTDDCGPVETMRGLSRRAGGTVSRRVSLECGESMCARSRSTAGVFLQDSSGEID